jgi:exopolysaccharide biosynthesis polyprenyl glycosylphosphotransferase
VQHGIASLAGERVTQQVERRALPERPTVSPNPRPRITYPAVNLAAISAQSCVSARSPFAAERSALVAVDLAVVAGISLLAGSTVVATLIRAAITVLALGAAGLYRQRLRFSALDHLPRIVAAAAVVLPAGAWLAVPTLLLPPAFAAAPLVWPAAVVAGVVAGRAIAYGGLYRRRGRLPGEATVVIGSGDVAVRLAEALATDRTYGLAPLGLVGPPPVTEPNLPAPLLGSLDDLDLIIGTHRPRSVIVTNARHPDGDLVGTLRRCRRLGVKVYVVPRLFELALGHAGADLVRGIPLVRMRPEPPRRFGSALKRAIDVCGAAVGLLLLAPVLVVCAFAVRWEARRAGVVFRQERIGLSGKPFTIMKFRSLTPASDLESQVKWNIKDDARVGPVGRVLRGTSLDELPQLVNVLRGDMSLVGPRPERPYFVDQFERTYAGYGDRHRMPVGITGWAQIHGLRGDTSIEERTRFDNYYIENWSLGLDLKIIIRTIGSMLSVSRR